MIKEFFCLLLGVIIGAFLGVCLYFKGLVNEPEYQFNKVSEDKQLSKNEYYKDLTEAITGKTVKKRNITFLDKVYHFWLEFVNDNITKKIFDKKVKHIDDIFKTIFKE
ncbi:putative membrane protein [Candidatus Phytoplasma solani]|uniref:hypothetical protein n=1 Tax=Candidatus Phytoplasma solani TaxID=69896 RepID=UPI0032DB4997